MAAATEMGGARAGGPGADEASADPASAYEPPRIVWREPYEPLSFGLSCAKQPGNPGCMPGPTSS